MLGTAGGAPVSPLGRDGSTPSELDAPDVLIANGGYERRDHAGHASQAAK
jgi:hypothetical protein